MEDFRQKMWCISEKDAAYPARLRNLPDMPEKLYGFGALPDETKPSLAIVGARRCSSYGSVQAFRYARELAKQGIQIISGMAWGIDSEGHKGALEGGTPTFAVLGCGADVCYPAGNRHLYHRILREGGGIISELPPGTQPRPYFFPLRNRLISALSDVVLVVEAKEKSGSLITAGCALDQGKSVYALPGPVTDERNLGCHKLIYDGAGIAYSPEILLQEWNLDVQEMESDQKKKLGLAPDLDLLYACLDSQTRSLDYLVRKTGLDSARVSSGMIELILLGKVREISRNQYLKQD